MSKTKYVEYAGRGFWAYDVGLGVFLKHLIDAAEASDEAGTAWLSTAVSSWRDAACIPDIGLTLDAGLSAMQRQAFVALAEDACARLAKRLSIPAEEIVAWPMLDNLRIFPRGAPEVDTAPVVELGCAFIALVSGELPEAPAGNVWIYGTEAGRQIYPPAPLDERFEDFPDQGVAFLGSATFVNVQRVVLRSQEAVRDVSMVPAECGCAFRDRCNPDNITVA